MVKDKDKSTISLDQCATMVNENTVKVSSSLNEPSDETDENNSESENDSESFDDSEGSLDEHGRIVENILKECRNLDINTTIKKNVRWIDGDYYIEMNDEIILIKSKAPINIYLPSIESVTTEFQYYQSPIFTIINKTTNVNVNIVPTSGTINSISSFSLQCKQRVDIVYDGKMWINL